MSLNQPRFSSSLSPITSAAQVVLSSSNLTSATAATILNSVTNISSGNIASTSYGQNLNIKHLRKRPLQTHPISFGSSQTNITDKLNDITCPVCFEVIKEPYVTKCGHNFCFNCIKTSLEVSNRCPQCKFVIDRKDQIFPNTALNTLIDACSGRGYLKRKKADLSVHSNEIYDIVKKENLDLSEVNNLLDALIQKKESLEADTEAVQLEILKEFLLQLKNRKQQEFDKLKEEIRFLDEDLSLTESKINTHSSGKHSLGQMHVVPTTPTIIPVRYSSGTYFPMDDNNEQIDSSQNDGFNNTRHSQAMFQYGWSASALASRRQRMFQHFDDLQTCYYNAKKMSIFNDVKPGAALDFVAESLTKFTQFSSCKKLATLNYASDIYNGSSIVSSIEFDRDCDYFAIAGVTKKIKVFEYGQILRDVVDIHYPVHEMTCNSKISCISWSQYHKGMLASSDYEGIVTIWDAFTGTQTQVFQEHEKRCWSVDFNIVDPNLIASGSDDAKVKLWATNMEHSVATLEAKANVCCVKFNPTSRYNVAFGSADHCIHYYDLRNPKRSLSVLKGHRKAVSYAKFLDGNQIVSASTDSQLKLWDVNNAQCLRTYTGHSNEKNFVGLATNGDYIACGSENNSLFCYYKGVSKQLVTYKFDTIHGPLDKEKRVEESNEFVSAVCWKPGSNVIVAANSQGLINVLELI
ncbi:E3 ubiquitin-protein ligase COP1 isoform X1 [Hydra vulgaris]|uniref:E3 ubiquitin-protein ligase COP1 isoform X1 n=1 Tax=Hydra vulgaris TaxID=6087 RepID=UPI000640C79A|nr:E3 ubiquitin-protein ligase COP1 [Hydra vulgaris]